MSEQVQFPAREGGTLEGQIARPKTAGKAPAIVVIQEYWGLNDHVKSIVDRLAAAGFVALAPDLYHGKVTRDAGEAAKLMQALDTATAVGEIGAAAAYLASSAETNGKVGVLGFCLGGALSFASATFVPGLSAVVPFYGVPPSDKVDYARVTAPILAHFATKDQWAKPEIAEGIKAQIEKAGKTTMELHLYAADHAFFNDTRPEVHDVEASKLAWSRTLAFLHKHLG